MTFTIEKGDSFARFVSFQGAEKFSARDVESFFSFQLLPNLHRRGWIRDTGIKTRVRRPGKRWQKITVWEITKNGFEAAEVLKRRQDGLD